jgi:hypothetical protein
MLFLGASNAAAHAACACCGCGARCVCCDKAVYSVWEKGDVLTLGNSTMHGMQLRASAFVMNLKPNCKLLIQYALLRHDVHMQLTGCFANVVPRSCAQAGS